MLKYYFWREAEKIENWDSPTRFRTIGNWTFQLEHNNSIDQFLKFL